MVSPAKNKAPARSSSGRISGREDTYPPQETPSREEPDDRDLLVAVAGGDTAALGRLYERHGAVVLRVLRRYAGGLAAAELEDLRQEVFLIALEAATSFQGRGSVRAWLCGIAVRTGRARRRKIAVRQGLLGLFGRSQTGLAAPAEAPVAGPVEARHDASRALATLPEPQREVLLLHVVEGLSGPEIAAALEINEKTVWTRLHRARKAMREALSDAP